MPADVDNLALAVALLGAEGFARLLADMPELPEAADPFAPHRARAAAVAAAARAIAKTGGGIAPGIAYTAGLLHGVGSQVLHTVAPEKYKFVEAGQTAGSTRDAEAKVFTMAGPEAAAALAAQWNLPARLAAALRHQAVPAEAGPHAPLATLVAAAVAIVDAGDQASPETLAALQGPLADAGYSPDAVLAAARAA
jgi:HD-like signal output (HDOD) protein